MKYFTLLFYFITISIAGIAQAPFISYWNSEIGNSDVLNLKFISYGEFSWEASKVNPTTLDSIGPTISGIEWGAVKLSTITLPSQGTYRIKIKAIDYGNYYALKRIKFVDTLSFPNYQGKLIKITRWGDVPWGTMDSTIVNAPNVSFEPQDVPNLSEMTSLAHAFQGAQFDSLPHMSEWDVSNITDMSFMFAGASNFNQDLSNWNTNNVSNMNFMFAGAGSFNNLQNNGDQMEKVAEGIGDWDVSKVTSMRGMFQGATNFNQDIGDWDVSKVTNMRDMFLNATSFNQNLGDWDVSKINQNTNGNENDISFENTAMSCANYSFTLYGWATDTTTDYDVIVHAPNIAYNTTFAPFRDALINNNNWTFIGDYEGCSLNLNHINQTTIRAYPNPVKHILNIEGLEGICKVEVVDLTGRTKLVRVTYNPNTSLNLNQLQSGMYHVVITAKNGKKHNFKIIKN